MRSTTSLLAQVGARYLTPRTPTGLTGLLTAPSPRPTLIYTYTSTLAKLAAIPSTSIYRQSVEALTKQRLAIVESQIPTGYDAWRTKTDQLLHDRPDILKEYSRAIKRTPDGRPIVLDLSAGEEDDRTLEWDGEKGEAQPHGARVDGRVFDTEAYMQPSSVLQRKLNIEPEPALTAEQIAEIENQIGAGLIEEVIQVAQGEEKLLDEMLEAKPWEELMEKPAEGQWTYFERGTHTGGTEKPPN